tara:strand:+ start:34 stop:447 length:414 start_codon:yes stop_codon:yes gene_type:complete
MADPKNKKAKKSPTERGPLTFLKEAKDVAPDVFGAAYKKEGIRGVIPGMRQKKLTKKEIAEFRKERLAKEKREKERRKRNRERAKANPSLLKGGSNFSNGGLASAAKTVAGKTTRSRNKTKPRGVGVATRGYGKALK